MNLLFHVTIYSILLKYYIINYLQINNILVYCIVCTIFGTYIFIEVKFLCFEKTTLKDNGVKKKLKIAMKQL